MSATLVIVEVSQKQAYIFGSNKLRDNIVNSAVIAHVTSSAYYESCAADDYDAARNEVYCGGGHAVLEFADGETARRFIHTITLDARKRFPGLELFATVHEVEGEPTPDDVKELIQKLEKKKSIRRASFSQGSFGVEQVDSASRDVIVYKVDGVKCEDQSNQEVLDGQERKVYPAGYEPVYSFGDLGGSKDESNFIAVVHIDGNAMGKRVEGIREKYGKENYSWANYRKVLKEFSNSIDRDFKSSFSEMREVVARNITDGKLDDITLKTANNGKYYFPIRRIITEGDDICFVTEGRIGIECARIFTEIINQKTNAVDNEHYAVGAGVAIVHQKYPFYMAYELAEMLCSNAKKYIANSTKECTDGVDASCVSAIDWHIDFGELDDTMEEVRGKYRTADEKRMELRPYILSGPKAYVEDEKNREYRKFRQVIENLMKNRDEYARGKLKGLRNYIRMGENDAWNYVKVNQIDRVVLDCYSGIYEETAIDRIGTGKELDRELFIKTTDGESRCVIFDALEVMDTFILLN